jgi:hypothetical protein
MFVYGINIPLAELMFVLMAFGVIALVFFILKMINVERRVSELEQRSSGFQKKQR